MSLFKTIGRIGCDKCKFKVAFVPISMTVYSNHAFSFKLSVQRGDHAATELKVVKCERSLKNSDIKTINFPLESIPIDTTFFVEKGIPQEKTLSIVVVKCLPGGKEETIANGTVNLRDNFGTEFNQSTIEMTPTKDAKGSICKSFTY